MVGAAARGEEKTARRGWKGSRFGDHRRGGTTDGRWFSHSSGSWWSEVGAPACGVPVRAPLLAGKMSHLLAVSSTTCVSSHKAAEPIGSRLHPYRGVPL